VEEEKCRRGVVIVQTKRKDCGIKDGSKEKGGRKEGRKEGGAKRRKEDGRKRVSLRKVIDSN